MRPNQTRCQQEIHAALCKLVEEKGRPVTLWEITGAVNRAQSTVWKHLVGLKEAGLVAHQHNHMGYQPTAAVSREQTVGWKAAIAHLRKTLGATLAQHHAEKSIIDAVGVDLDEAEAAAEEL